jgi:hypothetical protein
MMMRERFFAASRASCSSVSIPSVVSAHARDETVDCR